MPSSMTGFGRAEKIFEERVVTVEIKSVNHRYFEFSCRTPRGLGMLDDRLKALVQGKISRGKLDMFVGVSDRGRGDVRIEINAGLAKAYVQKLRATGSELMLEDDLSLSVLARLPDILTVENAAPDEEKMTDQVMDTAQQALEMLSDMRSAEGQRLCDDISGRIAAIEALVGRIEEISPKTKDEYHGRLRQKMLEVLSSHGIDENRILAEAAIFAERIAVDEETVRLKSHLQAFMGTLALASPVGRKLDFVVQELNREINTIGSKAQDISVTALVIEIKSELEKVREQIQNLE